MIFLGAQVSGKMGDITSVEDIYVVGRDLTSDSISWMNEWSPDWQWERHSEQGEPSLYQVTV